MDTSKLAPETRRVWEALSRQPALGGFVLIGGTALAMHLAHRVSEDLDFITLTNKLPRNALNGLMMMLQRDGFSVDRDDDENAYEEFLIAGESLYDYQQNFLIDSVKVNLFIPNPDLRGMIEPSNEPLVRVASLLELFRTKALAAANRYASRDWIDLYVLLKSQRFTLADFHEAFQRPNILNPGDRISQAFQNLCRGVKAVTDPGYEALAPNAPSIAELAKYFTSLRDDYQTEQSRLTFQRRGLTPE